MREQILFAPGCNGTDLVRTMAKYRGDAFSMRVMNATDLASYMLMKSGISEKREFLPRSEEASLINSFVKDIIYFSSAAYADAEKIANAIFTLRMLVADDEDNTIESGLDKGEFRDKNDALKEVYLQYKEALEKENRIDTIGYIRKAIEEASPVDADFIVLEEYQLTPLEEKLFEKASGMKKADAEISLSELFNGRGKDLSELHVTECYGESNEIESIIGYITRNEIPFDQCTIAVAEPSEYAQLFVDYMIQYDVPMTFGFGIPMLDSNPAKLLKQLYDWNEKGYNGINALEKIINSQEVDHSKFAINKKMQVCKMAGQLRISFDKERNAKHISEYEKTLDPTIDADTLMVLDEVKKLAGYFEKGYSGFINEYSYMRQYGIGHYDRAAKKKICETLDTIEKYSGTEELSRIIPDMLKKSVCNEISSEGSLFVTTIEGALSAMRPHLFVVGMSAANYPGSPRENYLLLDSDLCNFCDKEKAPTSTNKIKDKSTAFKRLFYLANELETETRVSYSGFNLTELKEANVSSILLDIYNDIHKGASLEDFKKTFKHKGFFDEILCSSSAIGKAVIDGIKVKPDMPEKSVTMPEADLDKEYSPSAIETYFNCPKRFYIKYVCGISEPEDDNPFKVINANQLGTLAHKMMESLANSSISEADFLKKAEDNFDIFLKSRPPLHPDAAEIEKKAFIKIMRSAYRIDPHNKVISAEDEWKVAHSSGIKLHGYPDRIEEVCGENIIVDFKVKNSVDHKENDIDTCLQVLIYAYMAEKNAENPVGISRCEYRYLKQGTVVNCQYDTYMQGELDKKIKEFETALETNNFPVTEKEDNCKYCKFADICGKERK